MANLYISDFEHNQVLCSVALSRTPIRASVLRINRLVGAGKRKSRFVPEVALILMAKRHKCHELNNRGWSRMLRPLAGTLFTAKASNRSDGGLRWPFGLHSAYLYKLSLSCPDSFPR